MAHGVHACLVSIPLIRCLFNVACAHGADRTVKKEELLSVQKYHPPLCRVSGDAKDFCKVCLSVCPEEAFSVTDKQPNVGKNLCHQCAAMLP